MSNRRKEINVYLTKQDFDDYKRGDAFVVSPNDGKYKKYKATLIIELPERKVTISESDFDVIFRSEYAAAASDPIKFAENLKQKLFAAEANGEEG